jgi:Zn finger protein HypA/HybF involved in hydrogenase expression
MNDCKCLRCGNRWVSRVERPKACPRCKRYDWNVDKEVELRELQRGKLGKGGK